MSRGRTSRGGTPSTLIVGSNGVLWALACHRGTRPPEPFSGDGVPANGTGTATTQNVERMIWNYANRSSPRRVWRMNNQAATRVGTNEGDPPALLTTLGSTISTMQAANPPETILALCGHGIPMGDNGPRWLCLHSGWDNQFTTSVNTEAGWNGYCLPFDWSFRNSNTAYVSFRDAVRSMTNVTQVHLYACGMDGGFLSSPAPIGQFAQDVQKEVWAYEGLINLDSSGAWMRVVARHGAEAAWGVRETSPGTYAGVSLAFSRGAMTGWQIRAFANGNIDRLEIDPVAGGQIEHTYGPGQSGPRTHNVSGISGDGGGGDGLVF